MHDLVPHHNGRLQQVPVEDESSKELVKELLAEGKTLVREEVRLLRLEVQALVSEGRQRLDRDFAMAKAELKNEGKNLVRAGGTIGVGGILAHAALYLGLFAAVFGLSTAMPLWLATLIVGAVVGIAAMVMMRGGITAFKRVRFTPLQTVHQLKEDKQWMREKAHALKSTIRANV
jgi:hypothetical protein